MAVKWAADHLAGPNKEKCQVAFQGKGKGFCGQIKKLPTNRYTTTNILQATMLFGFFKMNYLV